MKDTFREEAVSQHRKGANELMYYMSVALMIFSGFFALIELSSIFSALTTGQVSFAGCLPDLILGLVCAGVCVYLFLFRGRLRTEYEYNFTNGDLAFAAVYNNTKRKSLGNLNVKNVEAFGPVASGAFNRFVNMQGVKQTRWFLNRDGNLHFFFFQKEGNKRLIIFEPSPEMVEDIKLYLPRGVYQEH